MMWNMGFHIKGRTQIEGVCEQGAEVNIWTYKDRSDRRLEKILQWVT
jgi:hypothetical protein